MPPARGQYQVLERIVENVHSASEQGVDRNMR
jgi:hypothetical protein